MATYERLEMDKMDIVDAMGTAYDDSDPALHPRPAFRRQSSSLGLPPRDHNVAYRTTSPGAHERADKEGGLGISYIPGSPERIRRVPVGSKETLYSTLSTPDVPSGRTSQAETYHNTPSGSQAYVETPDTQELRASRIISGGVSCPTHRDILDSKMSWLSISIVALAVYSTVFSGLYLIVAMWKPRWGQNIGTQGHISFSTASLLSALFAKTIELSFVTVFVTFLGQALSRRAFRKSTTKGGISIAEMTMRTWVMQPGTLITHWEAVRYSALSILGGITLLAAFAAVFYTTAAEALVAPKLKDGPLRTNTLQGMVATSFANAKYLANNCQTPVARTDTYPEDVEGDTCLSVEHAGQSFHNFKSYIDTWVDSNDVGNLTNATSYDGRPPPIAMLYDNTTVQGQWIHSEDPAIESLKEKRMVQRITMAMPHANLFNAARYPANSILQPAELGGAGEYTITASLPVPISNVLCVGMTEAELVPLVYSAWPNPQSLDSSSWPSYLKNNLASAWSEQPNKTAVDNVFGFRKFVNGPNMQGINDTQLPPVFFKYPIDYNTVASFWDTYGQLSVYLLAKPPVVPYPPTDEYVLCSLNAMIYNNCSTQYHAEQSGGHLSVYCDDDPQNTLPYMQSQPHQGDESILTIVQPDWQDIATEWIDAISLSQGIADGNASGARMLTQMIPPDTNGTMGLLSNMPSIGEALSVLVGCTLLLSSSMSPFVHYWNYDETVLVEPQVEIFNASIISRDYTSGGTQQWQGIFYVILVAVFIMNVLCLLYLCRFYWSDGQVTDFTEPQNLFSLAINSPPSSTLSGSCGAGPEGNMFAKRWQVGMQSDDVNATGAHPHFYVRFPDDEFPQSSPLLNRRKKRSSVRRMSGFEEEKSPAVEQYERLSGKWSSIL